MPSRFLNNITVNDEYTLPSADGTANQVITTDGAGQLSFVDQSTITAGKAEHIVIYAKNTSGSQINKGTPVYITGTVGATDTVQIAPADAGNASHMPAVGLLDDTLINNAFGYVITGGFMDNITTDPIDGATPSSNDTVYVKVGGGLTLTKPTGPTGLIQNVAKVGKVSGGNSGSLIVSSILRTNDVPNLPTGKIWVGDGNTIVSDTVYLDETNGRMGIGTTSPSAKLEVNGDIAVSGNNKVYSEGDTLTLRAGGASGTYLMVDDTVGGVGIGTSPSSELDVNGSVIVSSNLYLGSYVYHNGDINTYFGFPTNDTYAVRTNGSDRLYINSSGNVGIGTTSPDRRLHVQDSAIVITKLEGTNQGSLLDLVNSNASQTYNGLRFTQGTTGKMAITHIADGTTKGYVQIGNSWAAGSEILVVDGRTSNVGIGTSPTAKLTIGGLGFGNIGGLKIEESSSTADGAHFSYNDASRYVVFGGITNNVLNDAIAIERDATRTITIDSLQRVGIGTTSPSYKLDVSGTGRFTSDLTATDYTGNVNGLTSAQYSKFAFKTTGTGASDSGKYTKIARITLTGQYQNTATSLHYVSNGNGSTPISAGKLDIRVKQQAAFGNDPLVDVTNYHNYTSYAKFGYVIVQNTPTTIVDVYVQNTTTYNDITGYITTDDYINTTKITWYTNQSYVTIPGSYVVGNNRLLISANPSGNVSIGNTNDTYKLDVSGTGRFTSDLTVQGTGDSSFAGNVGIGTTSPSEKLEVDGTIKATDYKGYLTTFQHGGFQHTASTSSTTVYWIPTNSVSEVISSQSYNNWVAPYDGRVKKIVMRWASNGTPTATSVTFRKAINGTTDATLYSATVTSPATTDMIAERDFLSTDISFQAGDRVQLGFTTDGGTRLLQGFAYTIVLEYNKI
jgi:hypothetical protein